MNLFEHKVLGVYNRTLSIKPWSPPGVSMTAARRIWPSTRGENTVVAILDTGADYNHPDLKESILEGISFVAGEKDYMDLNGHGTHVAGTIAANGRILGMAPMSKLLIIKVLGKTGAGTYQGISKGLEYARRWRGSNGETVNTINMSLGGAVDDSGIYREVKNAVQAGITVVCAAGNEGDGKADTPEISYPAYYPETIAVGAVNLQTGIANFSNSNNQIDIVAPGVETYSTYPGGKYVKLSGTSMATPHISGAVALIYSRYKKRFGVYPSPETVTLLLRYGSIDLGEVGFDQLYGFGMFSFTPDGGKNYRFYANSNEYDLNGQRMRLNQAVVRNEGEIYGPLTAISDLLGTDSNPLTTEGAPQNNQGGLEVWE